MTGFLLSLLKTLPVEVLLKFIEPYLVSRFTPPAAELPAIVATIDPSLNVNAEQFTACLKAYDDWLISKA